jgi:hypothetical protein
VPLVAVVACSSSAGSGAAGSAADGSPNGGIEAGGGGSAAPPGGALGGPCRADGSCDEGLTLRDSHKLIEARDKFRICAAAGCPAAVQGDCAGWRASVEKALPSVVVTARTAGGASLIDVKVTVDGQPFATSLGGDAVAVNPGPHKFHFEGPGGTTLDQVVVAAEGDQTIRVAVVLGKASGAEASGGPSAPAPKDASSSPAGTSGTGDSGTAGASQTGPGKRSAGSRQAWRRLA